MGWGWLGLRLRFTPVSRSPTCLVCSGMRLVVSTQSPECLIGEYPVREEVGCVYTQVYIYIYIYVCVCVCV